MMRSGSVAVPQQTYALFTILRDFSIDISIFLDGMWSMFRNVVDYNERGEEMPLHYKEAFIIRLFKHLQHHSATFTGFMDDFMRKHQDGVEFVWPTVKDWRTPELNISGYRNNVGPMVYSDDMPSGNFLHMVRGIDALVKAAYDIQCDMRIGALPLGALQLLVREMVSLSSSISADIFKDAVKKQHGPGVIYSSDVIPKLALHKMASDLERLDRVNTGDKDALRAGFKRVSEREVDIRAKAEKGAGLRMRSMGAAGWGAMGSAADLEAAKEWAKWKKEEERVDRGIFNLSAEDEQMRADIEEAQKKRGENSAKINRVAEWVTAAGDGTSPSPTPSSPYVPRSPSYVPCSPPPDAESKKRRLAEAAKEEEEEEPVAKTRSATAGKTRTVLAKSKRGISSRGPRK